LTLDQVFAETPASLAQLLAARSISAEGKQLLSAAGAELEAELTPLVEWMHSMDAGLGASADTAVGKIRYQMNRLRHLAANFQLQREAQLTRQAETLSGALYPGGGLQERLHGSAYYFARHGFELAEVLTSQAANFCPGHSVLWL